MSSFHFLATINITIKCAYKYFDVHIFLFSLVLKPRVKLLGHRIGVDLTLKETAKYLSSYFKIPLTMYKKNSACSTSLLNFGILSLLNGSHFNVCVYNGILVCFKFPD